MKTIILTLIPVLVFLGILGIVILFGNWSPPQPEMGDEYFQSVENVVVTTNGLTFEENDETLSIIGWVENTSTQPVTLTKFKREAARIVGNCGIDYLNVAMIKGDHSDVQNYEQLLALKDQYVNFEFKDSDTKLPCKGFDRIGIHSVKLLEPKSIEIASDVMSKRSMNLYFGTDNPRIAMSDAVIEYDLADGKTTILEYELGYGKQSIVEYYDSKVMREQVSTTETKVYRNAYDFEPGSYTIIGSTMSGSISEPVVITMYPNYGNFDVGLNPIILFISVIGISIAALFFIIWRKRK